MSEVIGNGVTYTPAKKMTLDDFLEKKHAMTRDDFSPRIKMLVLRIEDYIETTSFGRPATAKLIADAHQNFTHTMLGIIDGYENDDPAEAMLGWDILLFLALQHKDTNFNPQMACRHFNLLSSAQQPVFLALMNLVLETMDIRNRANALRRYPLTSIYPHLNDIQRKRLTAYYAANT